MIRNSLILIALFGPFFTRADSIAFRNGGEIQGVIVRETDAEVTIKTGPGTATFRKNQLRSILHDEKANAEMRQAWQNRYFENPEFLPASLHSLAQDFHDLISRQNAALTAQKNLQNQREESARNEAELRRLDQQHIATAAKLQKTNPAANVDAYNQLVRHNNDIVSRMTLLQGRQQQLDALDTTNRATVSSFLTAMAVFRDQFEPARVKQGTNEQMRAFFAKAGEQFAAMNAALQEVRIPITDAARGHALVTARINDRADVRLLVDTGASLVTLSSASAARLHVKWDESQKGRARLADGTEIDVHPVMLDSLAVSGARLSPVAAVVIPDAPGDGIDGLLGMSYLRDFDVQIDSTHNQILLHRLSPTH
jgi:clan AA aspartic protease (TIGR02281 family)